VNGSKGRPGVHPERAHCSRSFAAIGPLSSTPPPAAIFEMILLCGVRSDSLFLLVSPEGFEPSTPRLKVVGAPSGAADKSADIFLCLPALLPAFSRGPRRVPLCPRLCPGPRRDHVLFAPLALHAYRRFLRVAGIYPQSWPRVIGLLNRYTGLTRIGGSNPPPSAKALDNPVPSWQKMA
jgi:hypothetical protein